MGTWADQKIAEAYRLPSFQKMTTSQKAEVITRIYAMAPVAKHTALASHVRNLPPPGSPPSSDWMNSPVFKMRGIPHRRIKRTTKSQYAKSKSVSVKKKPAKKITKKRMIKRTVKSQYAKKMTKSKKVKKSIKK